MTPVPLRLSPPLSGQEQMTCSHDLRQVNDKPTMRKQMLLQMVGACPEESGEILKWTAEECSNGCLEGYHMVVERPTHQSLPFSSR